MEFVSVGYGNSVSREKILAIINSDSNPAKRMIAQAKEHGKLIDATQGRPTRSAVVLSEGYVMLSTVLPETLQARLNSKEITADAA